jgi:hypothetical protein
VGSAIGTKHNYRGAHGISGAEGRPAVPSTGRRQPHAGRSPSLEGVEKPIYLSPSSWRRILQIGDTVAAADITGMVEGYDAADPRRASTFSLHDDWMGRELGQQGRTVEDYGALIEYLVSECRRHGASIHLGAAVTVIDGLRTAHRTLLRRRRPRGRC